MYSEYKVQYYVAPTKYKYYTQHSAVESTVLVLQRCTVLLGITVVTGSRHYRPFGQLGPKSISGYESIFI